MAFARAPWRKLGVGAEEEGAGQAGGRLREDDSLICLDRLVRQKRDAAVEVHRGVA
jgi:hypothetical protein